MGDPVVIIDGRNFVFRHFFTHNGLATEDGRPTGVLHGCLSGLLSLARKLPDVPFVFVWDGGGETWRHKLLSPGNGNTVQAQLEAKNTGSWIDKRTVKSLEYLKAVPKPEVTEKIQGYKATRDLTIKAKADKKAASRQIPELIKLMEVIGIRNFIVPQLEGDDLIGIMATAIVQRKLFDKVIIHSTDRDFYQLISPQIAVLKGVERGSSRLLWARREEIPLEFGIQVEDWLKYRAITGDKSDNIPNFIEGVGPVTAVKWLKMGLDPSLKKYEELPYLVKTKIADLKAPKIGLVDWQALWGRLNRNYICSQIVVDGKFEVLSEKVREEVIGLTGSLSKKALLRMARGRTEEAYREFTEKLAQWELAEMMGRRDEFRNLR